MPPAANNNSASEGNDKNQLLQLNILMLPNNN